MGTGHQHGCCATPPPGPGSEACLIPLRSDETPRCVEASGLLVSTEIDVTRCEWSCADGQICVRLRGGEQFLRIGVQSVDHENSTRVVLWRGQLEEIYDDGMFHSIRSASLLCTNCESSGRYSVATSVAYSPPLAPKPCHRDHTVRTLPMSPATNVRLTSRESRYTRTLTLSLFLLNVLPLPQLDGGILIDALLHHLEITSSTEVDIEVGSGERNVPSRSPRGTHPSRVLRVVTMGLLGGCVILAAYDNILRKHVQTT